MGKINSRLFESGLYYLISRCFRFVSLRLQPTPFRQQTVTRTRCSQIPFQTRSKTKWWFLIFSPKSRWKSLIFRSCVGRCGISASPWSLQVVQLFPGFPPFSCKAEHEIRARALKQRPKEKHRRLWFSWKMNTEYRKRTFSISYRYYDAILHFVRPCMCQSASWHHVHVHVHS